MQYRSVFDERASKEYSSGADHLKPSTEQVVKDSKLTDAQYMRDYLRSGLRDRGAKLLVIITYAVHCGKQWPACKPWTSGGRMSLSTT